MNNLMFKIDIDRTRVLKSGIIEIRWNGDLWDAGKVFKHKNDFVQSRIDEAEKRKQEKAMYTIYLFEHTDHTDGVKSS